MKIILSRSGGGKTLKIAELTSKYSEQGKSVQIITGEHTTEYFKELLLKENADLEFISVNYIESIVDVIGFIENDKESEVMFLDSIMFQGISGKTYSEKVRNGLSLISGLEVVTGKIIYVTRQARADSDEKLTVFDYVDPLSMIEN